MSEYEFDALRWCDSMKKAHFARKDFTTAENFKQVRMRIEALEAEVAALKGASVHIYNSGYHAGHHYTVEGGYVDIHPSDMDTYHAEEVAELLAALVGEG